MIRVIVSCGPASAFKKRSLVPEGPHVLTTTSNDKNRKWMWYSLAAIAAPQFYFVRELLAAFAMFALVFAATAAVIACAYMLYLGGAAAAARLAPSRHPVMPIALGNKTSQGAS
jgi:hypothetical protein